MTLATPPYALGPRVSRAELAHDRFPYQNHHISIYKARKSHLIFLGQWGLRPHCRLSGVWRVPGYTGFREIITRVEAVGYHPKPLTKERYMHSRTYYLAAITALRVFRNPAALFDVPIVDPGSIYPHTRPK